MASARHEKQITWTTSKQSISVEWIVAHRGKPQRGWPVGCQRRGSSSSCNRAYDDARRMCEEEDSLPPIWRRDCGACAVKDNYHLCTTISPAWKGPSSSTALPGGSWTCHFNTKCSRLVSTNHRLAATLVSTLISSPPLCTSNPAPAQKTRSGDGRLMAKMILHCAHPGICGRRGYHVPRKALFISCSSIMDVSSQDKLRR